MTVRVKVLSALLALGLLAAPAGAEELDLLLEFYSLEERAEVAAGYRWAEENQITDALDCDQGSDEFDEGCDAYVEEVGDAMPDDEDEDNEEAEEG